MKGEANSTMADKFKKMASPEEIAERTAQAKRDRDAYRSERDGQRQPSQRR